MKPSERLEIDVTGYSPDFTLIALFPYMAHPSNAEARERYGAFLNAKLYTAVDLEFSKEMQTRLFEAAENGVGSDFEKAIPGGSMAGDVLLARLEMYDAKVKDAGLDKACHVVSEYWGGFHNGPKGKKISKGFLSGEGKPFKAYRETVLGNWNKYKNAAHLWAAYLILLRDAEAKGLRNEPAMWLDGHKVASIAMALKTAASQVKTSRRASSVLPVDAIEIVGATPIKIEAPPLTVDFFTALNSIVSRKNEYEKTRPPK